MTANDFAGLQTRATELINRTDYTKLIDSYFEDKDITALSEASTLIGISQLPEVGRSSADGNWSASVKQIIASYEARSELFTSPTIEPNQEQLHESELSHRLPEFKTNVGSIIDSAMVLLHMYRHFYTGARDQAVTVKSFIDQTRPKNNPLTPKSIIATGGLIYNDQLSSAVCDKLIQLFAVLSTAEFDLDIDSAANVQFAEAAKSIDLEAVFKNMEIKGSMADLPFNYSMTDLVTFMYQTIPPLALRNIQYIEFYNLGPGVDSSEEPSARYVKYDETRGYMKVCLNSFRAIYEKECERLTSKDEAGQSTKQAMEEIMTHEFGHALHETLPVAGLLVWEKARSGDLIPVTSYVKEYYDKQDRQGVCEDFAESIVLFLHRPNELFVLSASRYNALKALYRYYMPAYDSGIKKSQDRILASHKEQRRQKQISLEAAKQELMKRRHLN